MVKDHKTVILTGASRGIGHSTVSFFSKKNWEVITCSREQPPEECRRDPNWSHHITADLEDGKSLDNFVTEAKELLACLLYTSPSPRDGLLSRMPSSA